MTQLKSPVDILRVLDKTNCKECGEQTCLAFATAVFSGRRSLSECPHLDPAVAAQHGGSEEKRPPAGRDVEDALDALKKSVAGIDLEKAAQRLGARYANNKLTLKVMGKDFSVHADGTLSTDIHVNPWVAAPVLDYVLSGQGIPPGGEWVQFRDLPGGAVRWGLYQKRVEEPLKKVADTYTELFDDLLELFNGKRVEGHLGADISIVLHPLPLVPILVCYWKPEEGIESDFRIFLDRNTEKNLSTDSAYTLCGGIAQMLEKLSHRHGI